MRPRDNQRKKIYDWEYGILPDLLSDSHVTLSLIGCQLLVDLVRHENGCFRSVKVADGRGRRRGCFDGRIKLPVFARRTYYVLHEVAHSINREFGEAAHGPAFAATYLDLLCEYVPGASRRTLRSSMIKAGIKLGVSAYAKVRGDAK